jgi:chromate transporter
MSAIHWDLLWALFSHCTMLSLLAIGGAMATAPELQRFVVVDRGWMSGADFTSSVALAQASPGPNLMFIPVVGFGVAGLPGAIVSIVGMMLPSTALTLGVTRWGMRHREDRSVRAFVAGMMPVTLGLLAASGSLLAQPLLHQPVAAALMVLSLLVSWRTKLSPMWLIALGGVVGVLGWV